MSMFHSQGTYYTYIYNIFLIAFFQKNTFNFYHFCFFCCSRGLASVQVQIIIKLWYWLANVTSLPVRPTYICCKHRNHSHNNTSENTTDNKTLSTHQYIFIHVYIQMYGKWTGVIWAKSPSFKVTELTVENLEQPIKKKWNLSMWLFTSLKMCLSDNTMRTLTSLT